MKVPVWLIGLLGSLLMISAVAAKPYLFVSARGAGQLEVYSFNAADGALELARSLELKGGPGNSVVSPDRKYLYVAVSSAKGGAKEAGIETLALLPGGEAKSVGYAKTPYRCGFLSIDSKGSFLLSSHYGEGRVTSYQLENGIYKGKVLEDIKTDDRAHSVRMDRNDAFAYVPHTSPNKVYQFSVAAGKLTPLDPPSADGPDKEHRYHEPRHCIFHPKLDLLYTSNERGGGLTRWGYDASGKLTRHETVCTLADDAHEKFAASDITISPDGQFVYVANRDGKDRKAVEGDDSIAAYRLDPTTGEIKEHAGNFDVGRHPRCISIDPSGQYLFGAGVNSNNVTVYLISKVHGALSTVKVYDTGESPMWLQCIDL